MKKNKIILSLIIMMSATMLLSACNSSTVDTSLQENNKQAAEDKNAEFKIAGKLTASGNVFFVTDASGKAHDVESYSIDLNNYLNTDVVVVGQYSGDTLFVTSIE